MSNSIKISVIVPVYNRETGIGKCIENILAQDYGNYEVILVDDASTDKSGEVCEKYAKEYKNIFYIRNEKNLGPGLTRNVGLDKASGDYILFLDSDDKYDTSLLSKVIKGIDERNPDILVYSLWEEYYDANEHLQYRYSHSLPTTYMTEKDDIHNLVVLLEEETMLGYPWNKAYNLSYLKKCSARFTDIAHVEDILFNIEAFENVNSLVILEDKLYHYCNKADNRLTDKYLPDYWRLQRKRIIKFLSQQIRWGTIGSYALSVASGEYFRWLLSAVERMASHHISYKKIKKFLDREYQSKLYLNLRSHLSGGKPALLYKPMVDGNAIATIVLAKSISLVKHRMPGLFAVVKQHR